MKEPRFIERISMVKFPEPLLGPGGKLGWSVLGMVCTGWKHLISQCEVTPDSGGDKSSLILDPQLLAYMVILRWVRTLSLYQGDTKITLILASASRTPERVRIIGNIHLCTKILQLRSKRAVPDANGTNCMWNASLTVFPPMRPNLEETRLRSISSRFRHSVLWHYLYIIRCLRRSRGIFYFGHAWPHQLRNMS